MEQKKLNEMQGRVLSSLRLTGDNVNELIVRVGEATEPHDNEAVEIDGNIDSPRLWLEKRAAVLDLKECHIIVNRERMTISLVIREKDFDADTITGRLVLSPEMRRFDINGDGRWTNFELARLFKMNRTCFANRTVAMELVTTLQNFKAKVDKELEKYDDRRGDKKFLLNQVVQSNLPEAFTLRIPVLKGAPREDVLMEVDVDPNDFTCALVSPDAADRVTDLTSVMIDDEVRGIAEAFPQIVIVEQ